MGYTKWILDSYAGYMSDSVLEMGIGQANYINFLPVLTHYMGVDIDAAVIENARKRHPNYEYIQADMDDPQWPAQLQRSYDTVMCFNALQYSKDEVQAIRHMMAALRPGGHVLLLVPAMPCLMGHMDVLAGHRYRYKPEQLRRYAAQADAKLVRLEYFNPIGAVGWWLNNHFRHDSLEDDGLKGQIVLFDRYVVPMSRLVNPLTKRLFGQSLLCVLQK